MKTIQRLTLCALFALCSIYASAYDFATKNDDGIYIYYNIVNSSDWKCEVTHSNYPGTYSGSVTIPEKVKRNNVSMTYTVVGIGEEAFGYSSKLTDVVLPSTITYIDDYAFDNCSGLTLIDLPSGVTTIGRGAFYNCSRLTIIDIPSGVTSIGSNAFYECSELTYIYSFNPKPPVCSSSVFSGVNKEICTLYVPIGSYNAYATADQWQDFYNIVEKELTNEGFYEKFVDDVEDLEAMLQEIWDVITSDYSDVANEFKDEYDSLVDELDKLLEEIMDAYRNGTILDRKYEFMEKIEELKQKIEALLATAKEAHETSAGIDSILINSTYGAQTYGISGTLVATPMKGHIYITRHADGHTKKFVSK